MAKIKWRISTGYIVAPGYSTPDQCRSCPFLIESWANDPTKKDMVPSCWCGLNNWYWDEVKQGRECKPGKATRKYSVFC